MANLAGSDAPVETGSRFRTHRLALRTALVAVVVTIVVTMVTSRWGLAWVPVLVAMAIVGMDLMICAIDRHARAEQPLPAMPEDMRSRMLAAAEQRVGLLTALAIAGGLVMIAVVIAVPLVGWPRVGIGAVGIFMYMALLGWPVWVAAIEDEVETEHERLTGAVRSSH